MLGRPWNFFKSQSLYGRCEIQYIDIFLHIPSYFRHVFIFATYSFIFFTYSLIFPTYFLQAKQKNIIHSKIFKVPSTDGGLAFHGLTPGLYSSKFFQVPNGHIPECDVIMGGEGGGLAISDFGVGVQTQSKDMKHVKHLVLSNLGPLVSSI